MVKVNIYFFVVSIESNRWKNRPVGTHAYAPVVFECCKDLKSWQKAAQNFFSDIWILMRKELFVTLLRVPYVQSEHVRGVFKGKI